MTRYKVKVSVELAGCNESVSDTPTKQQDRSFSMLISEKDAVRACLKTLSSASHAVIKSYSRSDLLLCLPSVYFGIC